MIPDLRVLSPSDLGRGDWRSQKSLTSSRSDYSTFLPLLVPFSLHLSCSFSFKSRRLIIHRQRHLRAYHFSPFRLEPTTAALFRCASFSDPANPPPRNERTHLQAEPPVSAHLAHKSISSQPSARPSITASLRLDPHIRHRPSSINHGLTRPPLPSAIHLQYHSRHSFLPGLFALRLLSQNLIQLRTSRLDPPQNLASVSLLEHWLPRRNQRDLHKPRILRATRTTSRTRWRRVCRGRERKRSPTTCLYGRRGRWALRSGRAASGSNSRYGRRTSSIFTDALDCACVPAQAFSCRSGGDTRCGS